MSGQPIGDLVYDNQRGTGQEPKAYRYLAQSGIT